MTREDDALYGNKHLSSAECWEAIRGAEVGRLGVIIDGHPEIFPVNYTVDGETVVFRTGEGTKLDGALSGNPVVFEVDGYDPGTGRAWSAVLKGEAGMPESTEDIVETLELPIFPWQGGIKSRYVRIVPDEVTGRRFRVQAGTGQRTSITGIGGSGGPS
jgi:uncharacterized protein